MANSLSHKRILVVDDSIDIRESLFDLLRMEEYEVELAEEGQKALNYLNAATTLPDLILLDLLMPVKDGYQLLCDLRADGRISGIPVIIMTANQMQDAKSLGTAGFLRKPLAPGKLLAMIRAVIR
jgi:DNA-binding response OmpR family regulator